MPNPKDDKTYSTNQVVAILEDIKSDFRVVTEGVTGLTERVDVLSDRVERVENRLSSLETKVEGLDDAMRISVLPRLSKLETKVG